MNQLLAITGLVLVCVMALAGGDLQHADAVLTTQTAGTGTLSNVSGYLEDIQVLVTDGVSTGVVSIALLRPDSTVGVSVICTNTVTDEKLFRPCVDFTDAGGTALTSDPPRRWFLWGETVRMIITGSPTNKTWRMRVKTADR